MQQLPGSGQILHPAPEELPGLAEPAGARAAPYGARVAALDPRMLSRSPKEQKDALDNLCGSSGIVVAGTRNLLYGRRADSRPVSHCVDSNGNSPVSGAQDRLVRGIS